MKGWLEFHSPFMTHRFQMNRIKQEKEAMHQHIRATDKTKDHLSDSG